MNHVLSRHRWIIGASAMLALALMAGLSSGLFSSRRAFAAPLAVQLKQLSSDPYTNSSSQHKTEVEPDTFSYGSTIVVSFQAGRFYSGGGSSNIGWATSTDKGITWKNGFLSGITKFAGGTYQRASDAAVAYDAAHSTWLISSLALSTRNSAVVGVAVLVSRSTDGGLTWGKPIVVAAAGSNDKFDKEW